MPISDAERLGRLEHAVFGVSGDDGMLKEIRELRTALQRLYVALNTAAISFAVSAMGIALTLIVTR